MYSLSQESIIEKVGPAASALLPKNLAKMVKFPRIMCRAEVFETCDEVFPKLSKRLHSYFLAYKDNIIDTSDTNNDTGYYPLTDEIEISFTNTVKDVAAIAHEVGHAMQRDLSIAQMTLEIYPRVLQRLLDGITGDTDFDRDFHNDSKHDGRKLAKLYQEKLDTPSHHGLRGSPAKFCHLIGSLLALPIAESVKKGEIALDEMRKWHDGNAPALLNKHKITHIRVRDFVEDYIRN